MRHAMISIHTEEPDYSALPVVEYDWAHSIYGMVVKLQREDWPTPRGKHVTSSHFVDANLYHDIVMGRSITGILHLTNKTPIDWYSKKQGTIETATFGLEFAAARTCTERIIDLRDTLRYMGVPIHEKSYMFGDKRPWLTAPTPHMGSYTSDTPCLHTTEFKKQLPVVSFTLSTSQVTSTLRTS